MWIYVSVLYMVENNMAVSPDLALEIGMVFKYDGERVCNGKALGPNKNIIQVGYISSDRADNIDESRKNAMYVIQDVIESDDYNIISTAYDLNARVFARRLHEDGSYNKDGEVISFWQTYKKDAYLSLYQMNIVKIMRRVVTYVDELPCNSQILELNNDTN